MMIHGSWHFTFLDDNTLMVSVIGAWNKEAAIAFSKEFKQITAPLLCQPWGLLVCMQNGELVVPEAITILEQLNQWAIDNNCRREANIVQYQIHNDLIERTRADEMRDYVQCSFTRLADALDYLKTEGFAQSITLQEAEAWLVKH